MARVLGYDTFYMKEKMPEIQEPFILNNNSLKLSIPNTTITNYPRLFAKAKAKKVSTISVSKTAGIVGKPGNNSAELTIMLHCMSPYSNFKALHLFGLDLSLAIRAHALRPIEACPHIFVLFMTETCNRQSILLDPFLALFPNLTHLKIDRCFLSVNIQAMSVVQHPISILELHYSPNEQFTRCLFTHVMPSTLQTLILNSTHISLTSWVPDNFPYIRTLALTNEPAGIEFDVNTWKEKTNGLLSILVAKNNLNSPDIITIPIYQEPIHLFLDPDHTSESASAKQGGSWW
ncbi:hypothetical protein NEDG_01185 [Nematocida displodere]|uniref:Uncharacterized protein n=1 Tax=Nematocida displodere TaxID=1805483 RepID=A0A177EBD8_9MICR|nr:hypothetical protein NEDG_01185 [Nematocida displodere]